MTALASPKHNNPPVEVLDVFQPFLEKAEKAKVEDAAKQFDYSDKKSNAEARSYLFALRKERAAIESARKQAKDESLQYGKRVDADAKIVEQPYNEIIERHEVELKKIEQAERDRASAIQRRIDTIKNLGMDTAGKPAAFLIGTLDALQEDIQDFTEFAEYEPTARAAFELSKQQLNAAIDLAAKWEAEQAELKLLREQQAKAAEAEQARLAKEAYDKRIAEEANAKVEQERRESAEREQKIKDDLAKAEREKQEAIDAEKRRLDLEEQRKKQAIIDEENRKKQEEERVKREREEAIEIERKRQADALEAKRIEDEKEALAEEKRQQNKKHREGIESQVRDAIISVAGTEPLLAKMILLAIKDGKIPHVSIDYSSN